MSNIEMIQKLLNDKADLQAQINISAFDGSIYGYEYSSGLEELYY